MHPGSLRYSSLAYDEYAALLAPRDPGALASAQTMRELVDAWNPYPARL
jgi:hypothetical protein